MRIKFVYGSPSKGQRDYEADAVPRVGDAIATGTEDEGNSETYRVRTVQWCPDEPDYDVYVFAA